VTDLRRLETSHAEAMRASEAISGTDALADRDPAIRDRPEDVGILCR
jgi:hypothetical protein